MPALGWVLLFVVDAASGGFGPRRSLIAGIPQAAYV